MLSQPGFTMALTGAEQFVAQWIRQMGILYTITMWVASNIIVHTNELCTIFSNNAQNTILYIYTSLAI